MVMWEKLVKPKLKYQGNIHVAWEPKPFGKSIQFLINMEKLRHWGFWLLVRASALTTSSLGRQLLDKQRKLGPFHSLKLSIRDQGKSGLVDPSFNTIYKLF